MKNLRTQEFQAVFQAIDKKIEDGALVVIAIEGPCGSGKTTLAQILSTHYDCSVVHMDHFFLQPYQRQMPRLSEVGGNVDYERFIAEVVPALTEGRPFAYGQYQCQTQTIGEEVHVKSGRLTIVEGVYSMHPKIGLNYDLTVFLDIDPETQKARIIGRSTEAMWPRFEQEWIPKENAYFEAFHIRERCDINYQVRSREVQQS